MPHVHRALVVALVSALAMACGFGANAAALQTPRAPATEAGVEKLPIGMETFGGLRVVEYPRDDAVPGVCAIDSYARTRLPPLNSLYGRAVQHQISPGAVELIGKLPDDSGVRKILQYERHGDQINILVALKAEKSAQSQYIWGELPKDLPAGMYHVTLMGAEYEEKDGQLVPAAKSAIRAFYQLECFVPAGQTAEQIAAWQKQDKAVEKTFGQIATRLKFLEMDYSAPGAAGRETLYTSVGKTGVGDLVIDSVQFQHNWDLGVPRKPPAAGTSGIFVSVAAMRYDPNLTFAFSGANIAWDGTTETRRYSLDTRPLGWKVSISVQGNKPESVKKVEDIVDEELGGLARTLAGQ